MAWLHIVNFSAEFYRLGSGIRDIGFAKHGQSVTHTRRLDDW